MKLSSAVVMAAMALSGPLTKKAPAAEQPAWVAPGLPGGCSLKQYLEVPFPITARILLPPDYDNPATPRVERLSQWQSPRYKVTADGKDCWFQDHFIVPDYGRENPDDARLPPPVRSDLIGLPRPQRTLYYYADLYGIPRTEIERQAFVFFTSSEDDGKLEDSSGIDGIQMAASLGGRRHYLLYEASHSSAHPFPWIVAPTRVPSTPPPARSPVPPEFAASPDLRDLIHYQPDTPEFDEEDVAMETELVDAGVQWHLPGLAGKERLRIWRGDLRDFTLEDYPAPDCDWAEVRRTGSQQFMRAWFLIAEEDLRPKEVKGRVRDAVDYSGEPMPLPVEKAVKLALEDVRTEMMDWYDLRIRRREPNIALENYSNAGVEIGKRYQVGQGQLVFRTFRGRRIALWYVRCRESGRASETEERFVLMDGHVIRPTWVDLLPLMTDRRAADPAAADALTKQRRETYLRWRAELGRWGITPGLK